MKSLSLLMVLTIICLGEATGVVSNGAETCGTCVDGCGQLPSPTSRKRSCSCDVNCVVLDDCCQDFPDECPEIYANATKRDFYPNTRGRCVKKLVADKSKNYHYLSYTLISTCPANDSVCEVSGGSFQENLASKIPVMDTATNISFSNAACAVCNGVQNAAPWTISFVCNKFILPHESNATLVVNGIATTSYLEKLSRKCSTQFDSPPGAVLHKCRKKKDDCPSDNVTLQEACHSPFQQLTKTSDPASFVYHNPACAECHNETGVCGHPDFSPIEVSPSRIGAYSLAVLVDFTRNKGLVLGRKNCPGDKVWSDLHMKCMPLLCKDGYEPLNSQCVSYIVKGYLNFTLHLTLVHADTYYRMNVSERNTWDEIIQNATSIIEHHLHQQTPLVNWTVDGQVMRFVEGAHSVHSVCLLTYDYVYSKKAFDLQVDRDKYHQFALYVFKTTFEKLMVNRTEHHASLYFGVALGDLLDAGESRDYDCHRHHLKSDRFVIKDEILIVNGLGREYLPFEYIIEKDGDALVCTYSVQFTSLRFTTALGIFTIVCLSISLVCLAIRLILQIILPIYHTFPMRLQAMMCLSMFCAFFGFLLMPSLEKYFYPCYAMGVATHYGFLSFYFWLAAIAAHTWVSFLPSSSFIKSSQRDAKLWPRMLFAWGVPFVLVVAAVAVDQLSPNYDIRPGYGLFRCWFNRKLPHLFFFVIPLACIVVVNLFFFVSTVYHLQQNFRDCNAAVKKSKVKQFRLFTKLFVIMGLTEILSFIAPFVDFYWLWYIYIAFNATMGLFVLWAFVLTKPVLKDAKSWWNSNISSTFSTSSTASTTQSKSDQTKSTPSK